MHSEELRSFHPIHSIGVEQIRSRDFRISVDPYGRLHTNLTNLKREIRKHLRVDGQTLVNVDIGEAQPLLIGMAVATAEAAAASATAVAVATAKQPGAQSEILCAKRRPWKQHQLRQPLLKFLEAWRQQRLRQSAQVAVPGFRQSLPEFADAGIGMIRIGTALQILVEVACAAQLQAAMRAARANRLQRSVNLLLGSALSTIGLTVPAVLAIGLLTGQTVVLGLEGAPMILLLLTLLLSSFTFGGVRTNLLQGAVHLVIFLAYLVLVFNP